MAIRRIKPIEISKPNASHPQLSGCLKVLRWIVPNIEKLPEGDAPSLLHNPKGNVIRLPELRTSQFVCDYYLVNQLLKTQRLDLVPLTLGPAVGNHPQLETRTAQSHQKPSCFF